MTTAHSTLQAWGDDDSRYSLDEHEPLLWLVDEEVIASIALPTKSSTTTSMSVEGEGLRRRSDSPQRFGVSFVEQLKSAWDRDGSAPVSVVSLDARTELAGSLSLLTIQRWPARWSLTYHWVGETSQLSANLLFPLDGLVDASAPDGHAWRGFGGGGSCGSGHTRANLDFAGVLADDVTELDLVWPGPNGHPQLTMQVSW